MEDLFIVNACRFWGCLPSQLFAEDVSVLRMMEVYLLVNSEPANGE